MLTRRIVMGRVVMGRVVMRLVIIIATGDTHHERQTACEWVHGALVAA